MTFCPEGAVALSLAASVSRVVSRYVIMVMVQRAGAASFSDRCMVGGVRARGRAGQRSWSSTLDSPSVIARASPRSPKVAPPPVEPSALHPRDFVLDAPAALSSLIVDHLAVTAITSLINTSQPGPPSVQRDRLALPNHLTAGSSLDLHRAAVRLALGPLFDHVRLES